MAPACSIASTPPPAERFRTSKPSKAVTASAEEEPGENFQTFIVPPRSDAK
jgi:hypothetical protein